MVSTSPLQPGISTSGGVRDIQELKETKKADNLAKEACIAGSDLDLPDTINRAKKKVDERYAQARASYFEANTPQNT